MESGGGWKDVAMVLGIVIAEPAVIYDHVTNKPCINVAPSVVPTCATWSLRSPLSTMAPVIKCYIDSFVKELMMNTEMK